MGDGQKGEPRDYFKEGHVAIFKLAAKRHNVYIAMRRINKFSLGYIGAPDYVPKPLDCKAKTANIDHDPVIEGQPRKIAGLVVDWDVLGEAAFTPAKRKDAEDSWKAFKAANLLAPPMRDASGKLAFTVMPGKIYATEFDKSSVHYGCLKYAPSSVLTMGKYIHGDYDIYDIVPAGDVATNVVARDKNWSRGTSMDPLPHSRGKQFFDVQYFIKSQIRMKTGVDVAMIQHGEQVTFKDHTDEPIDIFCPDGRTVTCANEAETRAWYSSEFRGRQTVKGSPNPPQPASGNWIKVGPS